MTSQDLLSRLQGVRRTGAGWIARCPSHDDRSPSLSIREADGKILLHCFAGCEARSITAALGVEVKDLFHGSLPDPRQRREAMQRRAQEYAARRAASHTRGRRADARRHAEYLIQSARGINIEGWSNAELNKRLNALAAAYEVLERECHD